MFVNEKLAKKLNISSSDKSSINSCKFLGLVTHDFPNMLTYIVDERFINDLNKNTNVKIVLTNKALASQIKHKTIICDKPDILFWSMVHFQEEPKVSNTVIGRNCIIDNTAIIHKSGVTIGDNVQIDAGVVILPGTDIKDNVVIGPNSVLGGDGFMVRETIEGKKVIKHSGKLIIGEGCNIGRLCNLDKGILSRDTILRSNTFLDSKVHIAHNCVIGYDTIICAGVIFSGNVEIGDNVFIGTGSVFSPRLNIASGSYIGAHSTVTRSSNEPTLYLPPHGRRKALE